MIPRLSNSKAGTATQILGLINEDDVFPSRLFGDDLCTPCASCYGQVCAVCTDVSYVSRPGSTCPAQDWQTVHKYLRLPGSKSIQIAGTDSTRNLVFNARLDEHSKMITATTQPALLADIFSSFSNRWWSPDRSSFAGENRYVDNPASFSSMTEQRNFSTVLQTNATAKQPYVQTDCRLF